ncbi:MAG: succinylglutamate desuccinylase/aspartoacylase family protein [Myxococcota bacterium]
MSILQALQGVEGVTLLSAPGAGEGPVVGVVGAVHGNERCGLEVVLGLAKPDHPLRRRLRTGTLVLLHGNPLATEEGRRHTHTGVDLNRQFDFNFQQQLPQAAWTFEHHRAWALKPILEQLDAVLDLHSATSLTPPFVIATPGQVGLAEKLGCPLVTWGWDQPGLLSDKVLTSVLLRRGMIGLSVECGQHGSLEAVERAWDVTERFLSAMGMLEGEAPPLRPCLKLELLHRVGRPTPAFRFSRPWEGGMQVMPGELLGEGGGIRLCSAGKYRVLLPNPHAAVGEDMLYLAEERS